MAATLTRDGELTLFSFPIEKVEQNDDGSVDVEGLASNGDIDSDQQIIDPDFAAKAIRDWLDDGANVRVQHNPQRDPAGVGISMNTDEHGGTWVKSHIVEPVAVKLVKAGALRAYSVGIARPQIVRDPTARGGRIKGGQIVELSLVDRPANKACSIQLVKSKKSGRPKLTGILQGDPEFIAKAISSGNILIKAGGTGVDITKVGPHGYVHGWIKVGSAAHDELSSRLSRKKAAAVIEHLDAAHAAHSSGDVMTAKRHLQMARGELSTSKNAPELSNVISTVLKNIQPRAAQGVTGYAPPAKPGFTDTSYGLKKGAGVTAPVLEKTVTLELPEDVSVAFSPADLARVIAKRAKDPNVGEDLVSGGVDRDKMPGEDFAGRNRSFPIHSPGDVADAAQSIGRAGEDNYDADTLKRNIKRIAHRKGPEYAAQLPEAWKNEDAAVQKQEAREYLTVKYGWLPSQLDELSDDSLMDLLTATKAAEADVMKSACTLCHGTGKIREGHVTCPRCHGSGSMPRSDDGDGDGDDDTVEKGHGRESFTSGAEDESEDADTDDDMNDHDDDDHDDDDDERDVTKNRTVDDYQPQPYDAQGEGAGEPVTCPNCGKGDAADARYCDQCGFHLQGADGVTVKGKKPFPGAAPPFGGGEWGNGDDDDSDSDDTDRNAGTSVGEVADADEEKYGAGAMSAEKARKARKKRTDGGRFKTGDGAEKRMRPDGKFACKCGTMVKAKHAFCPGCGAAMGGVGEVPDKTGVKKGAVPGEGVRGHEGTVHGIPRHREPDGAEIEAYEDDAGLQDGDEDSPQEQPTHLEAPTLKGDVTAAAVQRILSKGVPVTMGVLHDFTCPAFSHNVIQKCYPDYSIGDVIDEGYWQQKSLELAASLPFPDAAHAAQLGAAAVIIKSAPDEWVTESRNIAYKAFSDANPGPGTAPTPVSMTPGKYNRPYISAGHAAPSPAQAGPNTTPVVSGEITASMFNRPPLLGGHEAPSPANAPVLSAAVSEAIDAATTVNGIIASAQAANGSMLASAIPGRPPVASLPASFPGISKGRTFYSNTTKEQTRAAMRAIHDHVAKTFPDLCPVGHGDDACPPAEKAAKLAHEKAVLKAQKLQLKENKKLLKRSKLEKMLAEEAAFTTSLMPAEEPEITKAATVTEVPDYVTSELSELRQLVTKQSKMLKKQAKALDSIASQEDPTVTAFRGILPGLPPVNKQASQAPVGPGTMADVAERTQAMMLAELEKEFRTSPDPGLRESAWRSILKLRGVG